MGLHCITQPVNTINGCISSGIKADAVIGAANVIVNRCRNGYNIDAVMTQSLCTTECTVTANGNDTVQTKKFAGRNSLLLAFLSHKFFAARGVQDCTTTVNGTADALFVQLDNIAGDQAVIASADAVALNAVVEGGTDNGPDSSIHTRSIAAAGQNTDSFNAHSGFLHM